MQKTPRISMPVEDVTEVSGEAQSESRGSLAKATTFLFTLLAIGALGTGLYYAYCQLINGGSKLANVTADLNNKIAQDQSAISTLQKAVQDNQQTSEQLIAQLHANQQSQDQWRVSEAQYLTSLANDNLQLGDNVGLVVTLLQNADQKLRDLSDPRIATIRRALANDIVAMQAVAAVDVTGIYLQLSALNDQVDKLVLPVSRPEATPAEAEDADKRMSWWRRGLRQSWEALSKVIVVRYNQGGERPFIPPDQQAFLTQNLHAMFEQALSATVHRQTTIYRTSLGQAQTWIKKYYLADSSVTQAMLTNLNQLQNQTLRPALPELTASLQAFHDYFAATETAAS
jgi:uroporphyrin-3 C-methyltransferase